MRRHGFSKQRFSNYRFPNHSFSSPSLSHRAWKYLAAEWENIGGRNSAPATPEILEFGPGETDKFVPPGGDEVLTAVGKTV